MQPFIINNVVGAIAVPGRSSEVKNSLIAATALAFFSAAVTNALYQQSMARATAILRCCFTAAVYDHSLQLGAADLEDGASIALITADIPGMEQMLKRLNNAMANILSITAGLIFLAFTVGAVAIFAVVPITIVSILCYFLSKKMKATQKEWNSSIEGRVNSVRDMLGNMKSIRMTGLSSFYSAFIESQLDDEIQASKRYRFYYALQFGLELISIAITPITIVIGAFTWNKNGSTIPAESVYSIMAVSVLIVNPLGQMVHMFGHMMGMLACHDRVQAFLRRKPLVDKREPCVVHNSPTSMTGSAVSLTGSSTREKTASTITIDSKNEGTAISVAQVYTSAISNGKQVLQSIDAYFPAQQLTVVVGSVGSGKSTLLKLLAGEVQVAAGRVLIDVNGVAYCDQLPWVRSKPVQKVITGFYALNEAWFREVTQACCLEADFAAWQNGASMEAGNGGCNLSGGQKQRVALARALYSRKPIILIDDIFSALDRETSKTIFENLFGDKGMLRKSKSTVILVTHLVEHLRYADSILRFDDAGSLERVDKSRAVHIENWPKGMLKEPHQSKPKDTKNKESILSPTNPGSSQPGSSTEPIPRHDAAQEVKKEAPKEYKVYLYYLESFGVLPIIFWLVWLVLQEAFFKAPSVYLRIWLERNSDDKRGLIAYAMLAVGAIIFSTVSIWYYFVVLIPQSSNNIHSKLLNATMKAASYFFSTTDNGSLLNRFGQDMILCTQDLPFALMYSLMLFCAVFTTIGIIASGVNYASGIIPVLFISLFIIQRFYLATSKQMRLLQIGATAPLYTLFDETIAGIQHIRAFKWTSSFKEELVECLDHAQKPLYQMLCIQQWLYLVLDLGVCGLATFVVSLGLDLPGSSSAYGVGLSLVCMIDLSVEIALCFHHWAAAETAIGAVSRVLEFEKSTPQELVPDDDVDPGWPERGWLKFSKVIAKYNAVDSTSPDVLVDAGFIARPGEKIGIVGRTGSGKSSIIMAILQMMDYIGTIELDGVQLRSIDPEVVRSRFTTITQDAILIPGSVRLNMDPFGDTAPRPVTDRDLIDILQKLGLWSHISRRGGLDAVIPKIKLSAGQRQMLNIARGIVHHIRFKSIIALMDEITSQVDRDADTQIQAALSDFFKGCTVLVIAHREETLRDANAILEVTNGRIKETRASEFGRSAYERWEQPVWIPPPPTVDYEYGLPGPSAQQGPTKPSLPSIHQVVAHSKANPTHKLCFQRDPDYVARKAATSSGTRSQKLPMQPIYERKSMESITHTADMAQATAAEQTAAADFSGVAEVAEGEKVEEDSRTENGYLNAGSEGNESMGPQEKVTGWLQEVVPEDDQRNRYLRFVGNRPEGDNAEERVDDEAKEK